MKIITAWHEYNKLNILINSSSPDWTNFNWHTLRLTGSDQFHSRHLFALTCTSASIETFGIAWSRLAQRSYVSYTHIFWFMTVWIRCCVIICLSIIYLNEMYTATVRAFNCPQTSFHISIYNGEERLLYFQNFWDMDSSFDRWRVDIVYCFMV